MSEPTFGTALAWYQHGGCPIPTRLDGTKAPFGEWKRYIRDRPPLTQVINWFQNDPPGVGLVLGHGGLEMFEFEGRALNSQVDLKFEELCRMSGLEDVWDRLWRSGYVESTPSGGIHFIYRVPEVLPSTKLARRQDEDGTHPLIETKGQGGFVIVAPSHGPVHPSGDSWEVIAGEAGVVAELTVEERDALFGVARACDEMPPPVAAVPQEDFFKGTSKDGLSPGDDFEARTPWYDILVPHGWYRVFVQGNTAYWRRPGKTVGISATTGNAADRDRLYVFSTSTAFEAENPYTKFAAHAMLNHGGDYSAAARELASQGFGERTPRELNEVAVEQAQAAQAIRVAKTRKASEFAMRNPRWLWATENGEYGRIPLSSLTLFAGKAGVGKTTLECTFASWLTRGEMKGQYLGQPKDVLFVPYEDDIEETIVPRLAAAKADLDRVHFVTMETLGKTDEDDLLLPVDCEVIAAKAIELGAVAIFVDPLSAALSVDNANDQKKVRRAAQAVQQMARKHKIAVLGIVHTRKAITSNLLDAIMGSSELSNVARAAIGLMRDDDVPGTVVLSQEKNNGGRLDIPGYRYKINPVELEHEGEAIRTSWMDFIEKVEPQAVTAMLERNALSPGQGRGAMQEAKDFIMGYLMDHGGSAHRKEVLKAANAEMLTASRSTLDNAAKALKVTGHTTSPHGYWTLDTPGTGGESKK